MKIHDHISQFPHCDPRVLHAPEDNCKYCNKHPDWQALRMAWGIAFTGRSFDKQGKAALSERGEVLQPCPAEADRGMESINSWGGNVPMTPATEKAMDAEMDKITATVAEFVENREKQTRTTLSGKPADSTYDGPAPQDIDPQTGMHKDYWVLAPEERAKGFVRPVRRTYVHLKCGTKTSMGQAIAETYARDPQFYNATFCFTCGNHYPVGENGEFVWEDGSKVGT